MAPIFQILLFAYIGRSAGLESDEFYVVGNAIQYAAIPCLFAMTQMIGGERYQNTLSAILVSPAHRVPLFFGRSLPVIANGAFVSAFSLTAGTVILGVDIPRFGRARARARDRRRRLLVHGLGLINAALSLRSARTPSSRTSSSGSCSSSRGPTSRLSSCRTGWPRCPEGLPFTHAIEAHAMLADGASFTSVAGLIGTELLVGLLYAALGYAPAPLHGGAEPPLRDAGTLMRRTSACWRSPGS